MSDKPRTDRNTAGDPIIDAEVEPLAKTRRSRGLRVAIFLVAAILISVAVAVVYQLASTGRLDNLFAGRSIAPTLQTSVPVSPPASTPSPLPAPQAPAAPMADNTELLQRLDEQEKRLSALTASIERLQQLPTASGADDQKLEELEQAIASLRQADNTQAAQRDLLTQQVAELQARFAALSEGRIAAMRAPLLQVLAWSELREKARRGAAFRDEFERVAQAGNTQAGNAQEDEAQGREMQQALAALRSFADTPPPAAVKLAARFAALAEAQREAVPAASAGADAAVKPWWQRAWDKVTGLISIRRIGETDTATPEGKLAMAEAALQQGDLDAAQSALADMQLTPELAEWRDQVQARLKLDAALDAYGAALQAAMAQR